MKGRILLKHSFKRTAGGLASVLQHLLGARFSPGITVLMYHRVTQPSIVDLSVDDWNVSPTRFEQHVAWLSRNAECLKLDEIPSRMDRAPGEKPRVAVTFDDGYANFATEALPVLKQYCVPAAVFLVTRFVGSTTSYPFDRWAHRNMGRIRREAWRPISWDEVRGCINTGLVTFGSHSHTHPDPRALSSVQLLQEAVASRGVLLRELGEAHAFTYAYPYGSTRLGHVNSAYRDALVQAGFSLAFTTDLGAVGPGVDQLALPRVEAHSWDSAGVIAAKVRGILWPFRLTDAFRRAKRV